VIHRPGIQLPEPPRMRFDTHRSDHMKMISGAWLVSFLAVSGCASMPSADDARQELFRTDQAWAAAASAGKDVDRVASFWSDDGVIVPAGAPVVAGKAAIREFVAGSFATPGFHIGWTPVLSQVHVSADGTMGYSASESTTTFPGPDGKLVTLAGRGVSIWRRDADGQWKCVYDTWNHGP
jgi:ketosteroid isomerase-like protein